MIEDLGHITNPKNIVTPFVNSDKPNYTRWNATNLIVSKSSAKCPILGCKITQPDCKTPNENGITVDPKSPFGIFVVSNNPSGWMSPICLTCTNKDDSFSIQTAVNQQSCEESGGIKCSAIPTANVTEITDKTGSCVGHLNEKDKQITPKNVVMPFN